MFFFGDIMYALGMNTTKKVCVGLGQTDEEGKKFAKFDEVVAKVQAAAATPDSQGSYADYIELMKLYDKNSNGTMMLAELDNILANLGDEVPKEEVQKLFAELVDPEDEVSVERQMNNLACTYFRMASSPTSHLLTGSLARLKF